MNNSIADVIGVIPAAGRGTRISPLPMSKELFPVGFRDISGTMRPKVAGQYLLEQMARADIKRCFIVVGDGKWDIPAYFGCGESLGIELAYSVIRNSPGTPHTLDNVYSFVSDKLVAMGFPDMLFESEDIYRRLLDGFRKHPCDVMLGLFPAEHTQTLDVVAHGEDGAVERIEIKPEKTSLTDSWGVAVWTPKFTRFMHDWLPGKNSGSSELSVGHVIIAAIEAGLKVRSVKVSEKPFLDIGTPRNLMRAIREHTPGPGDD